MMIVEKLRQTGYILTVIDENGEIFQKHYTATEIEGLKRSLKNIQTQNRYLSIEVTKVEKMATFTRGTTKEVYTFNRTVHGVSKTTQIADITRAFK